MHEDPDGLKMLRWIGVVLVIILGVAYYVFTYIFRLTVVSGARLADEYFHQARWSDSTDLHRRDVE